MQPGFYKLWPLNSLPQEGETRYLVITNDEQTYNDYRKANRGKGKVFMWIKPFKHPHGIRTHHIVSLHEPSSKLFKLRYDAWLKDKVYNCLIGT